MIPETIWRAEDLARLIEKEPIVAGTDRDFGQPSAETVSRRGDDSSAGRVLERIEVACGRFGMEMGPFRIMDEIGLDVTMHSGWTFFKRSRNISGRATLTGADRSGRLGQKRARV